MRSVELFAGGGGLALGAHLAGFTPEIVAERDRWCCDTLRENQATGHPLVRGIDVREGDVRGIEWGSVEGGVDLVTGGPPCQPFSGGGKGRAADDPRDMFPATADVIRALAPRAFVIENVRGLTRRAFAGYFSYIQLRLAHPQLVPKPGEPWADHMARLRARSRAQRASTDLRYSVSATLVNAADYGVPQQRWRVFLIGFRADLDVRWSFPRPTHSAEALRHQQDVTGEYWERHKVAAKDRTPSRGALVPPRRDGDVSGHDPQASGRGAEAPASLPWRTVRDAIGDLPEPTASGSDAFLNHVLQLGARSYPGHTGSRLDAPAKALKAGVHGVPGGENMLRRPDGGVRYFTVREAARLQTFPDSYRLHGPWGEAMRQLGNAVPVRLAQIVASSVREHLEAAEPAALAATGSW